MALPINPTLLQIAALTAAEVATLTLTELRSLDGAGFTAAQLAGNLKVKKEWFSVLQLLAANQVACLSGAVVAGLNKTQLDFPLIDGSRKTVLQALTVEQRAQLSHAALGALAPADLSSANLAQPQVLIPNGAAAANRDLVLSAAATLTPQASVAGASATVGAVIDTRAVFQSALMMVNPAALPAGAPVTIQAVGDPIYLDPGSDTGVSNADGITYNRKPVIRGVLAGSRSMARVNLTMSNGTMLVFTPNINANRTWSIDLNQNNESIYFGSYRLPSDGISEGGFTVTAQNAWIVQSGRGRNLYTEGTIVYGTFTVDSTVPNQTVNLFPEEWITPSTLLSGTTEIGANVQINISGPTFAATVDSAGNWTANLPSGYLPGSGNVNATITSTDKAGNVSRTTVNNIRVDAIAPTISSVFLSAETGAQNGVLNGGDSVTATVSFSEDVVVTAGTPRLQLMIGDTPVWADYVSGSDSSNLLFRYTIPSGSSLNDSDGISIPAATSLDLNSSRISDLRGNALAVLTHSGAENNSSFRVDTLAPTLAIDVIAGNDVINASEQNAVISGTCAVDTASMSLSLGGNTRTALVSGSSWSYTLTPADITAMGQGNETITATATDGAGNSAQATRVVSVFTNLTIGSLSSSTDSGQVGDGVTNYPLPTITGSAPLGSAVWVSVDPDNVWIDPFVIYSAAVDPNGNWSIDLQTAIPYGKSQPVPQLPQGLIKIGVICELGGVQSDQLNSWFTVDTTAPETIISGVSLSTDSGTSADFITNAGAQTISGTLSAGLASGERVMLSLDNGISWTQAMVSSANWSLAGQTLLSGANRELWVKVVDTANNDGSVRKQAYTLDSFAPTLNATLTLTLQTSAGVAKGNAPLKAGDKIILTINLNEAASGLVGLPAAGSANATVIKFGSTGKSAVWSQSGNSLVLTYTVVSGDSGAITLDEAALKTALGSSIQDQAGNLATIPTFTNVTDPTNGFDFIAPTLSPTLTLALKNSAGAAKGSAPLKAGDKIVLTINLNEAARGLVGLPAAGTINATVIKFGSMGKRAVWSQSGNSLVLTYTVVSGDSGAIAIDETALKTALGVSLQDLVGNLATIPTFTNVTDPTNGFDFSAPSLSPTLTLTLQTSAGVAKGNAPLKAGDKIILTINLNEAAGGLVGLPAAGSTNATAIKFGSTGKSALWSQSVNNLVLTYTVVAGDSGVITIDETALKTALGSSIQDRAGNGATIPTFTNVTDPTNGFDFIAPTLSPTLTLALKNSAGVAKGNAPLKAGDKIILTINLNEAASGLVGLPTAGSTNATVIKFGSTGKSAVWSQSGNNLVLTYTVVAGDSGAITIDETALKTVLGSSIQDRAGNVATIPTFANVTDPTNVFDFIAPTTTISTLSLSTDSRTTGDFITQTAAQTISGTLSSGLASGEAVQVSLNNGSTWTQATVSGTNWSLAGQTLLSGAGRQMQVKVVDAAGNNGVVKTQTYTLDTSLPSLNATLNLALKNSAGVAKGSAPLKAGDQIALTINLNEAASGLVGLPVVNSSNATVIKFGGTGKSAVWSQSGNNLVLTYTVVAGDSGAITIDEAALKTALGSSLQDLAGNVATIPTFTNVTDPTNGFDFSAPTLSLALQNSAGVAKGNAPLKAGDVLQYNLQDTSLNSVDVLAIGVATNIDYLGIDNVKLTVSPSLLSQTQWTTDLHAMVQAMAGQDDAQAAATLFNEKTYYQMTDVFSNIHAQMMLTNP
jgi:hypothetical protein